MEIGQLLWSLADKYAPASKVPHRRPRWFDHAGDLVVAGGRVKWDSPWCTDGGFSHALPAGAHPVYAGTWAPDPRHAEIRPVVSMIVIPVAAPERIAEAKWGDDGYDDIHLIEDYAILWGAEARHAAVLSDDDVPSFFPAVRDRIVAEQSRRRRGNWEEVVLDPETGANAFVFPVDSDNVDGHEIVDDGGKLLCLVLIAHV